MNTSEAGWKYVPWVPPGAGEQDGGGALVESACQSHGGRALHPCREPDSTSVRI